MMLQNGFLLPCGATSGKKLLCWKLQFTWGVPSIWGQVPGGRKPSRCLFLWFESGCLIKTVDVWTKMLLKYAKIAKTIMWTRNLVYWTRNLGWLTRNLVKWTRNPGLLDPKSWSTQPGLSNPDFWSKTRAKSGTRTWTEKCRNWTEKGRNWTENLDRENPWLDQLLVLRGWCLMLPFFVPNTPVPWDFSWILCRSTLCVVFLCVLVRVWLRYTRILLVGGPSRCFWYKSALGHVFICINPGFFFFNWQ